MVAGSKRVNRPCRPSLSVADPMLLQAEAGVNEDQEAEAASRFADYPLAVVVRLDQPPATGPVSGTCQPRFSTLAPQSPTDREQVLAWSWRKSGIASSSLCQSWTRHDSGGANYSRHSGASSG